MKMNSKFLAGIVIVVMLGGVLASVGLGLWDAEDYKEPARLAISELEEAGLDMAGNVVYDPADIRGSSSFGEISEYFGIPLDVLGTAFLVPNDEDLALFQNKDLEEVCVMCEEDVEVGNGSVKFFVSLYNSIPYEFEDGEEDVYLFAPAVELLKSMGHLDQEMIAYLDIHTIEVGDAVSEVSVEVEESQEIAAEEEDHNEDGAKVNRNTTFAELLDAGVTQEAIEEVMGLEMPNRLTSIFDFCSENELSFGTIKVELQALVDTLE